MEKLPTVKIQGRDYILVKDRVLAFNESYPKGCIITELISPLEAKQVVFKATVYPEGFGMGNRQFNGWSQAVIGEGYINKTAALENAETSAVGRALAFMGIGVIDSIASADEIRKAKPRKEIKSEDDPVYLQEVTNIGEVVECHECGGPITAAEQVYSKEKYGKQLCRACQKLTN